MEKSEKEYKVGLDVLKTIAKSLVVFVCLIVLVALGFFVINPKLSAKFCASLGWKHLEASCYELVYARSKNNADLYNLIVKLGGINKYDKQSNYIKLLQNNTEYNGFCENADDSVVANYNSGKISAKELAFLYGTNEYLSCTLATNYIVQNKLDDAYSVVLLSKTSGDKLQDKDFELAVYYFVDYIYSKAVSEQQCETYGNKLLNDDNIMVYLASRQAENELVVGTAADKSAPKILGLKLNVKIYYTKYVIYKVTGNNALAYTEYTNWQSAVQTYNDQIA